MLASLLLVSLATACGSGQKPGSSGAEASHGPTPVPPPITLTDYPSGFPTTYINEKDPPDHGLLPVDGGLQGHASGTLRSADGTRGTYESTWIENRVPALKVDCNGVTYRDLFMGETPEITTKVDFSVWGKATLTTEGRVVVYASSRNGSSPAVCDDQGAGGTFLFEFTNGPAKQLMSGTWHWDEAGDLVFDPPGGASEHPSPSASAAASPS